MKTGFSRAIWGLFLLLAAAFVLTNQFGGFAELSAGSIIAAVLAVLFIVQCIADLSFSILPVPVAVLYIVFQTPFDLPYIKPWTLIVASILALIGLHVLLPNRRKYQPEKQDSPGGSRPQIRTENGPASNNPSVSVHLGALSRRLYATSLETANLSCSFGALEVFMDQVKLSPSGAEALISCNFGAIQLLVPKQWHIVNQLTCTLGGVDDHNNSLAGENAPQLTLTGSVSFGGVEIKYV